MREIVRTKMIGIQIVTELTGEIAGIEDIIPMNKKYTFAILVYCNRRASKNQNNFTDKEIIPSIF